MRLYGRKRKLLTVFSEFLLFRVFKSHLEFIFYSISLEKWVELVKGSTLSRKKKFSGRFQDITMVCRQLFRIISIRRMSRKGHTMFLWRSTVGNVCYGRFFGISSLIRVVQRSISTRSSRKRQLSEWSVGLWVARKNFLWGSRTYPRYVDTSLGPYLFTESNRKIIRHVVRV